MAEVNALWKVLPESAVVYGVATLNVYADMQREGVPVLEIVVGDGTTIVVTANIGEMLGGAARGARELWREHHPNAEHGPR